MTDEEGCEMVEMRTEEKQTELMEPTVRWRAQETSSSLLFFFLLLRLKSSSITMYLYYAKNKIAFPTSDPQNPHEIQRKFWGTWMRHDHTDQTSASLDCKNSSTFTFDGSNMKDHNWDRKLCLKGPLQIELADGQRPACSLLSHDRCRS